MTVESRKPCPLCDLVYSWSKPPSMSRPNDAHTLTDTAR